jgi:hypothetical protein
MNEMIRKLFATSLLVAVAGMSGCAATADSIASTSDRAQVGPGESVVFGKFRLIRNGEEARIGSGPLATSAVLTLRNVDGDEIVGKAGANGEFAWALDPGVYRVSSIRFDNRGEHEKAVTNFIFSVDGNYSSVYIGTVTLEATFDSGYYGLNGVVDGYSVSNDCAAECGDRLTRLGLDADDSKVELMQQPSALARRN